MLPRLFLLSMLAVGALAAAPPVYEPYGKASGMNAIYRIIFADAPEDFRPKPGNQPAPWQAILYAPNPDPDKIAALAQDTKAESRVRLLAYNWLRENGREVPKGVILGVVLEVPQAQGLDTLAAYSDGGARYINQSGKLGVLEPNGLPELNRMATQIVELARPVTSRTAPVTSQRGPPPASPGMRLTVLASDGRYFGDGTFEAMEQDAVASPIVKQATQLLIGLLNKAKNP